MDGKRNGYLPFHAKIVPGLVAESTLILMEGESAKAFALDVLEYYKNMGGLYDNELSEIAM
ncbi:14202_t:CDS:2 [Entrophospora sp. SA101]|nr:14202_t:CDS:2 [Entrophospora sp. SA101]